MLPLEGIRVLDVTAHLAGPHCTTWLGDLGADVINVERTDEPYDLVEHFRSGGYGLDRNKRSICIDLKKEEGKKLVYDLAKTSDIFVENYRPGVAAGLGVGYDTLSSINPRIIYCSISGFGHTGPYADWVAMDIVMQGMSGLMYVTGEPPPGLPQIIGIGLTDLLTGVHSVIAIFGALRLREKTGKGTYLDMSMFDTCVAFLSICAIRYLQTHEEPQRQGSVHPNLLGAVFTTKDDKYLVIQVPNNVLFQRLCNAVGRKDFYEAIISRFQNISVAWKKNQSEILNPLRIIFKTKTRDEWVAILQEAMVPSGPVYSFGDIFSDPQVLHRKIVTEVERPPIGKIKLLSNPIKSTEQLWELKIPPALPGEHTDEILRELGRTKAEIAKLKAEAVVRSFDMMKTEMKENR